MIEALRLIVFALTVGIIALEGGILKSGTSVERLSSSIAILILIWGTSINLNNLSLLGALSKNHLEINKTLTHNVCMILNVLEISKLKYENS